MNALRPFDVVGLLDPLRRYARALARDESRAEDLVQAALLRAYERRGTFKSGANLKNWLFSILHNLFVDECRHQDADKRHSTAAASGPDETAAPHQESHIRLRQVGLLFERLPDDQKAVLYLIAVEGLSYQEAAASLGIPLGTLMSRLGRARAALRAQEDGTAPVKSFGRANLRAVGDDDD